MTTRRYTQRSANCAPIALFSDAEDAWFWAAANTNMMLAGARGAPTLKSTQKPCESADVMNAFQRLIGAGVLHSRHADVAVRYGVAQRRPNGLARSEAQAALLWEEAMDRLTTPLRGKGIIE